MKQSQLKVAAIQCEFGHDLLSNVERVAVRVREAAGMGAQVVLPPELFEGHYFCKEEADHFFDWARPAEEHPTIRQFQALDAERRVVIPASYVEKDGPHYYNSVAMVDAGGRVLGIYRKSHIPDGRGYEEKFYFRPGNTGFMVGDTGFGKVGVGI